MIGNPPPTSTGTPGTGGRIPTARKATDMHPIEITGVTKRYGRAVAVDDLTFSVAPGRVTGFLGPNGAGKSTLMKILLGLASADAGAATIGGRPYRKLDAPSRTVGAILEPNAFHPARTGRNHLRVLTTGAGIPERRIGEVLDLVELDGAADRKVGGYSLGMKQRLSLAAALLAEPPVLVLDEPGNGLDPAGTRWLRDLLHHRAAAGATVFVSSHLLAEMEQLADDLVVINRGRLVTSGTTADLRHSGSSVRTPEPQRLAAGLQAAGGTVRPAGDGALIVAELTPAQIGDTALEMGIALHGLSPSSSSLETLFLGWTSTGDGEHLADERVPVPA